MKMLNLLIFYENVSLKWTSKFTNISVDEQTYRRLSSNIFTTPKQFLIVPKS